MTEQTVAIDLLKSKLADRTITESELVQLGSMCLDGRDFKTLDEVARYGDRRSEALRAQEKLAADERQIMGLHANEILETARTARQLGYAGVWVTVRDDTLHVDLFKVAPSVRTAPPSGSRIRVNDFSGWKRLPESAHKWKVRKLIMDYGTTDEKSMIDVLPEGFVESANSTMVMDKHRHNLARKVYDRLVAAGADPAQLEADYTRIPGR